MAVTKVGRFMVERVLELERPYAPAREFFPDLTQDMLTTCLRELPGGQLNPDGRLQMSFHSFVVKTDRHVILVDSCCGNDKERPLRPAFHKMNNGFLSALAQAKVKPEQVDYVMCTHLHWDHVGWNTRLVDGVWKPTFPNAKYLMSKTEFNHAETVYRSGKKDTHTQAFEDSIDPILRSKQAVLVDDGHEVDQGMWIEPCHGHTPGNIVINLESEGQRGVLTGDVIHHQIQLRYPDMSTTADDNQDLARVSRTALIDKHAETGNLIFPAHFPAPTIGRIERNAAGGFRYDTDAS